MHGSATPPSVRVVIRLPYNRPKEGFDNPPPAIQIEWNTDKESILWEVIARSRASDSAGTNWQGLADHLNVPLPYLLYRAQVRYEEDLRGLQDLRGALSPTGTQAPTQPFEDTAQNGDRPSLARRSSGRAGNGKLSSSVRISTPLAVRARLNSLGYDSGTRHSKASSSSTLTLQATRNIPSPIKSDASADDSESESDEEQQRAEDEEKRLEEQEALEQKLTHLKSIMTSDAIGFVRSARPKSKGKGIERGRDGLKSPTSPSPLRQSYRKSDLSSLSASDNNSATSSPQGSIPSIPSPTSESLPHSPVARHMHHAKKSSSPPTIYGGHARGQSHLQYRPMVGVTKASASDKSLSSNQGSTASSFSDISETSLSASALESALLSNIRGGGSRLSTFARSQLTQFSRKPSSGGA